MSLLLLLLACAPSDRDLYLEALEAEPGQASALCRRIQSRPLGVLAQQLEAGVGHQGMLGAGLL